MELSTDDERRLEKLVGSLGVIYFFMQSCWKFLLKIIFDFSDLATQGCKLICQTWMKSVPLVRFGCWIVPWRCDSKTGQRPVQLLGTGRFGRQKWMLSDCLSSKESSNILNKGVKGGQILEGHDQWWCVQEDTGVTTRNNWMMAQCSSWRNCRYRQIRPIHQQMDPSTWLSMATEGTRLQGCCCIAK